jgi:DNA-binding GntR family transcriptional regulator
MMRDAANLDLFASRPALVAAGLNLHGRVLQAIRAGDGDAAVRHIGRHVQRYSEHVRAHAFNDIAPSAAFESTQNREAAKQ